MPTTFLRKSLIEISKNGPAFWDNLDVIFGVISDQVAILNSEGVFIYANNSAAKQLNLAKGRDLIGMNIADFKDSYQLKDEQGQVISMEETPMFLGLHGKNVKGRVVEYIFKETDYHSWQIFNSSPIVDNDGKVAFVVITGQDITAMKNAKDDLRLITDSVPVFMAYVDCDERYTFSNRQYKDWFNLDYADIVGKKMKDILDKKNYSLAQPYIQRALKGEQVSYEMLISKPRNPKVSKFVTVTFVPDFAADKKIKGFVTLFQDITEFKRNQKNTEFLAEVSTILGASLDYGTTLANLAKLIVPFYADWISIELLEGEKVSPVTVYHKDPKRTEWVKSYIKRYPPDIKKPHGVYNVIRTGQPELYADASAASLDDSESPDDHDFIKKTKFSSIMILPLIARGRAIGAMTLVWAESKRKYNHEDLLFAEEIARRAAIAVDNARLYKDIQDADQAKNHFVAMLAHELRNPLAPILSSVELMKTSEDVYPEIREASNIIERQVKNMARLLDDLLDISRIVRGKIMLKKKIIDIKEIVERAIQTVQPVIDRRQHKIVVKECESIQVNVDPLRLEQVIVNLLSNSAKYTEPHGLIEISCRRENGDAVITVKDNGIGIAPEMLGKVFDLFRQADSSLDRSLGGLGVGLTLAERIMKLHQGTIEAQSEGLGKGSTFIISLPIN